MIQDAIDKFEGRSLILKRQAYVCLLGVGLLLGFGVYIFFTASSLTATDIGRRNFDERLAANRQEMEKNRDSDKTVMAAVNAEVQKCRVAYQQFFSRWPVTDDLKPDGGGFRAIDFQRESLPDGDEIAKRISAELEKPENKPLNVIGIQLMMEGCAQAFIVLPRVRYAEVLNALAGQDFPFNRAKLNADWHQHVALDERWMFLQQVWNTIYSQKVQAEASGSSNAPVTTNDGGNELLLRLIQTSITRFGVLAVVGFLVSILVSLYRYNIRLAGFYTARADVLRLAGNPVAVSDFAILAAALSPNLEFGKAPVSPLTQLVELIKTTKDAK